VRTLAFGNVASLTRPDALDSPIDLHSLITGDSTKVKHLIPSSHGSGRGSIANAPKTRATCAKSEIDAQNSVDHVAPVVLAATARRAAA
jgi:hypothetical protein